ncbi:MAG: NADH:ubiquinone reductase (Na(+)-transporting) subunit B [Bacteroidetes bacterium]|jgi:Na+-transporting NADH:ubiquinone oxidoreductase subunit B|nr:NADH:ubiquinone reductase (Na(+)-transporting) subunit B [Bacteroidota bacterium]
MKKLREIVDNIKPHFEKGGKFEKLHSTFDAFETFLFVPNKVTQNGAHIRDAIDMKRTMSIVVMSLIPALLFGIYNTGYQHFIAVGEQADFWQTVLYGAMKVLPVVIVSYITGLALEFIFAQIRGHEVNEGFLVSGMLIPLVLPADIPLWMVSVATAFAVIIGKEVFGGSGMNILNPALTARAFLFFAYPTYMSGDKIWISGLMKGDNVVDGFSGSTILGQAALGETNFVNGVGDPYTTWDKFAGFIPGSIGETSVIACLLGAFILLYTGIGSWRIMFSVFIGGFAMGLILNAFAVNPFMEIPAWEHLIIGGFAFGAVFMATDPVTATQTNKGKYIYGFLIGFLAILIRVLNPAYPEGVMLAILLMNVFAPLIDHYVVEGNINRRLKRAKVKAQ